MSKEKDHEASSVASDSQPNVEFYDPSKESVWTRVGLTLESFKRAPGTTGGQVVAGANNVEDLQKIMADAPMLQQKMKPRHLTMIAVGGSIGTGLFVGSGSALAVGGPAGVLIAWLLIGVMLINVTQAIGEISILYPISGGFYTWAVRFLDPSFAFAMGWNYVFQWAVALPLEITVAATTVNYWPNNVPFAVWITIFWLAIIIISVFGTLGFAEEEFWSSCLKLIVVVMFILIGIVCICGGGPNDGAYNHYIGGLHWQDPGAFAHGFKGICAVFVTAAFSFSGTELVGLAASETPNPRASMPGAVKGTFWRIYPGQSHDLPPVVALAASPFVIALDYAKIKGLNHLLNAVVCVSVLSIGLSCVYASSRTLTALAETGYAPRIFAYVDKSSRPLWSVVATLLCAPLAYINLAPQGTVIFNWLIALSGLSVLFTWLSICLCHIRFRRAWKVQGHSIDELPFRAFGGVWGSWFGVVLITLVLIAQFYIAVWPVGGMSSDPRQVANTFFREFYFKTLEKGTNVFAEAYLAAPVIIVFYAIGLIWKRALPQRAFEIDLDSGRKSWLTAEEMNAWRADRRAAPFHIRMFRKLFTY
ncbi:hypothetical protein NP233_g7567 [Leucocoprinus birnbaumii]|uniref:Amino acid permease/ SLC12A domain-containing protein n=1 Tax=Leucocoprinus birnbaumii TaxID=56174 RepID=A0AAD5YPU9_9AGAR|nr:hypothetical protein NP233_g7567 [Leucocoprinus birnbaumii]